jgi:Zn-dependent M16 (insulinase) family peptidase
MNYQCYTKLQYGYHWKETKILPIMNRKVGKRMSRCIKQSKELLHMPAYQLEYEEELKDSNSLGIVFRHKKSGARICVVSNEDENKVFTIGFRTPPKNSTGVAHIIEHTVLCGSKEFPAKDPFIELAKGSLNTFLNAMTYSDKTIYPVASCNEKDFQNLIHVYMDAVFYPNIYHRREIFEQEGWHYELLDVNGELKYNGIVYSEMKGAFSSPEQQLFREIQASLFPETPYGVESGGDPDYVPELSYEEFLEFHQKFYHPSNSYIYLYGDMDVEEKLNWLDEAYLNKFDTLKVDSEIPMQKAFDGPKKIISLYPLSDSENEVDNTYLSYNAVIGTSIDTSQCMAFQVLEAALLSAPGAPLKQALLDAGIGKDILSSYDNEILQPTFTIIAKNANEEQLEKFLSVITSTLEDIVKKGLNEKSLLAAINNLEFRYREADFGQFPKGLLFGIQMFGSWLYDDTKAFDYMHGNRIFQFLKSKINTGYYEELIKKYLLNNTHATYLVLKPKKGLTGEKETKLKEKLEQYKNSLSTEEKEAIVAATKHLKEYQEAPSTKEELEKIPLLTIEDIKKEAQPLYNKECTIQNIPVLHHEVFTNGIAYIKCMFDLSKVPEELVPYLNLLATVLGYIDTNNYSFLELSNEINIHTGGMSAELITFNKKMDPDTYTPVFSISGKVLYQKMDKLFELINEILHHSKLGDTKRLYEIIREVKSRIQMRMNSAGHSVAVDRAFSYITQSGYYTEETKGIRYFRFLATLEQEFEARKEEIVTSLRKLSETIFTKDAMAISITAEQDGYEQLTKVLPEFNNTLSGAIDTNKVKTLKDTLKPANYNFPVEKLNEGFMYSGQVQYVARCANYVNAGFKTNGALKVLRTIMSYDYLWNNVRVKGGAYGCMCQFAGLDGSAYMVSYRDPNLEETDETYRKAYEYTENFTAEERDMTKYIIGTMSTVDTPLTPLMKGSRSLNAYMGGITMEDINRDRGEILSTTQNEIRKMAPIVKAVYQADNLCVIGNEEKIKNNEQMFQEIKALF